MLVSRTRTHVTGSTRWEARDQAGEPKLDIVRPIRSGAELVPIWTFLSILQEALNGIAIAIFILDEDRRVVFANAAAKEETAVSITSDGFLSAAHGSAEALRKAIARARAEGRPLDVRIDLGGRAARFATVVPAMCARRDAPDGGPRDYDMVLLGNPKRQMAAGVDAVAEAFDLTAGETRLLSALAAGDGLRPAAAELRIGMATARSHLQHIFAKTRTASQSELMRLVATLAAPARRD